MKLLLDQNLSRRILPAIAEEFPDSAHVVHLGMDQDDDLDIWNYAHDHGFVIVSKDKDFLHRSVLKGHPPKIIHITIGNCLAKQVADQGQLPNHLPSASGQVLPHRRQGR